MTALSAAPDIGPLLVDNAQLIGTEWVPASSGETIDVVNPANRAVLARVPRSGADDVDHAVRAAEGAFPAWSDLDATSRGRRLSAWADLIDAHGDELDQLERQEMGRPSWGPPRMGGQVRFIAGQADKVQGVSLPTYSPDTLALTLREPFGVVGVIIPWNAPGPQFVMEVAAAIAAGNTVVVKPAEDAPLT